MGRPPKTRIVQVAPSPKRPQSEVVRTLRSTNSNNGPRVKVYSSFSHTSDASVEQQPDWEERRLRPREQPAYSLSTSSLRTSQDIPTHTASQSLYQPSNLTGGSANKYRVDGAQPEWPESHNELIGQLVSEIGEDEVQDISLDGLEYSNELVDTYFTRQYYVKYREWMRTAILVSTLLWTVFILNDLNKGREGQRKKVEVTLALRLAGSVIGISLLIFSRSNRSNPGLISGAVQVTCVAGGVLQTLSGMLEDDVMDPTYSCFILLLLSITTSYFFLLFSKGITVNIALSVMYGIVAWVTASRDVHSEVVLMTGLLAVSGYLYALYSYGREKSLRNGFLVEMKLFAQQKYSNSLLQRMLPDPIIEKLKTGQEFISERHDDVTVLFSHIYNFDHLASTMKAPQLVQFLNEVFSRFDILTDELGVYKVETIGDIYMVSAGIPFPREDHAEVLCELALSMRDAIADVTVNYSAVQLCIGIHSGSCVAGVIGRKYPRYRLMGDTVNIASRMSTSDISPGAIQLSPQTYRHIPRHKYTLSDRGAIEMKGKGKMKIYELKGRVQVDPFASVRDRIWDTSGGQIASDVIGMIKKEYTQRRINIEPDQDQLSFVSHSLRLRPYDSNNSQAASHTGSSTFNGRSIHKVTPSNSVPMSLDLLAKSTSSGQHAQSNDSSGSSIQHNGHHNSPADKSAARLSTPPSMDVDSTDADVVFESMSKLPAKAGSEESELKRYSAGSKLSLILHDTGILDAANVQASLLYSTNLSHIKIEKVTHSRTLRFTHFPMLEDAYRQVFVKMYKSSNKRAVAALLVLMVLFTVYDAVFFKKGKQTQHALVLRITVCIACSAYLLYSSRGVSYVIMQRGTAMLTLLASLSTIAISLSYELHDNVYGVGGLLLICSLMAFASSMRFIFTVVVLGTVLVFYLISTLLLKSIPLVVVFITVGMIIYCGASYRNEFYTRKDFIQSCKQIFEEEQSSHLLNNMLPRTVIEAISTNQCAIAHKINEASVFFCDVVDFTTIASSLTSEQLVQLLNVFFTTIDTLSTFHEVYKVETVGDGYVACTGVVDRNPNHASQLVQFALDVIQLAAMLVTTQGVPLSLRIGINSGPLVAGVVGRKMPRYHLFGHTYSLAEAFESNGIGNKVCVSKHTVGLVQNEFHVKQHGTFEFGQKMYERFVVYGPHVAANANIQSALSPSPLVPAMTRNEPQVDAPSSRSPNKSSARVSARSSDGSSSSDGSNSSGNRGSNRARSKSVSPEFGYVRHPTALMDTEFSRNLIHHFDKLGMDPTKLGTERKRRSSEAAVTPVAVPQVLQFLPGQAIEGPTSPVFSSQRQSGSRHSPDTTKGLPRF